MFTGTQELQFIARPRLARRADNRARSRARFAAAASTVDDGPPVQRLTALQILSESAKWKAKGQAGDENALRVAQALEWVAQRRASQEQQKPLKTLAGRISAWMGLGESARAQHRQH